MTDRRRINGPPIATLPPVFACLPETETLFGRRPQRVRKPSELRKVFMRTGMTPSASGSAYLELQSLEDAGARPDSLLPQPSSLKLSCTVHGPHPLPRSAPFSSTLVLSTNVKYAPFASPQRRGFVRDSSERDLSAHLETALQGVVLSDRWPKSSIDIVITILEAEDNGWWGDAALGASTGEWGAMTVLAGCITVASAAIVEAGIDCADLVTGGVAAIVREHSLLKTNGQNSASHHVQKKVSESFVLDPSPPEHEEIVAACVVGYLASRDEITEIWMKGDVGGNSERLLDDAILAAAAANKVLAEALTESIEAKLISR